MESRRKNCIVRLIIVLFCKTLENQALISSYRLPREHKDPFDRMIIWQAILGEMTLLSVDSKMSNYVEYGLKLFE